MIREFSAGGIVFKKQITNNNKRRTESILWLVAQHSQHKGWVFPKGLIGDHDKKETKEVTAIREVEEETGVKAKIVEKLLKPATYFYTWQKEKRFKTVHYFLMEYQSGNIENHDWEMSDVKWLTEKQVRELLSFKSDQLAFKEALEIQKLMPS